jgi:histidinol dehydrogenase
MARRLDARAADFETSFTALVESKREAEEDVSRVVKDIIAEVRAKGNEALFALSQRFDKVTLTRETLRVSADEVDAAERACAASVIDALRIAAARIEAYHRRQLPKDERFYRCERGSPRLALGTAVRAWAFMCPAEQRAIRVRC